MAVVALVSVGVDARRHSEDGRRTLSDSTVAPLLSSEDADTIENSYIVVLKKDLSDEQLEAHHNLLATFLAQHGGLVDEGGQNELRHVYEMKGLRGYAGKFTDEVIDKVRSASEVDFIERDSTVYATATQYNAPWGLSRISHRETLTFRTYSKYLYDPHGGEGITAYIVDTGVNIHHVDFEGRAVWGATIPTGDADEDGNGHGTHVAGTVAGKRYGVAKKAKIVAVKVLRSNGSGTMSDVLRGVQWVAEAHSLAERKKTGADKKRTASVANMSLGGGFSRSLNIAVDSAVEAGVHFAVAAGNDNRDACQYSPASAEKAVTVGATAITDTRAWFSNYGKCTDVFAPGKDITSTWIGSRTATNTISGTSMASPHVCGLMAYLLSLEPNPAEITPAQLKDKIIAMSTKGIIEDVPADTKNLLVFSDPPATLQSGNWLGWVKTIVDKFTIVL
ncbi:peptidase S8/S53 domain-containing protein [Syncephalis pseudoplumigaleata]|uniref:Peptidase S8/S53 domain-containing protein n=1 Tax=Syncephalis pseudoplumigaleata TaxID=1712513 RepID=A0A4P9YWY6_9FUNG|nr:peptidase S8/S53 domain-containing protein [Syncephalis pseudoplumigaleata]|eukprot:RKP23831.1 peptidase S8/S53 domain-containing protein [Syncephalis pseudoplumigaleata]